VSLPAAAAEARASAAAPSSKGVQRPARLLVVDDNVDAADAIATLLSLNAYDVSTAHDPDEAMERAAEFDPDVILLDIGLPGMTGYELARKLHAHRVSRRAKLIAITGYGQPGDTDQAREAGFDGYLVKPVDLEQLHARIDSILGSGSTRT
jgi:CheY-like chemotaxis protein